MTPQKFASMFVQAATRKGLTFADIARETGMSTSTIYKIRDGNRVPAIETGAKLAEVLDMPALGLAVIELRTKQCIICTGTYVDRGRNNYARCCGVACGRTLRQRKDRQAAEDYYGRLQIIARRRMDKYTRSVLAFCRACEPEGMCRRASCELRPVSPLPLKASAPSSTVARIAANRGGRSGSAGAA